MSVLARRSTWSRLRGGVIAALVLSTWSNARPLRAAGRYFPVPGATTNVVAVDASVTYQMMRGWEVQNEAAADRPDYQNYRQAAVDKVAEAGINRIRFEVRSGVENPVDAFANWKAAGSPPGPGRGVERSPCAGALAPARGHAGSVKNRRTSSIE